MLYVLLYNKQLKRLEVLIKFLRFPECLVLLHGVEHLVAILSLVCMREMMTDNCRSFYFMCTYHKIYIVLCTFKKEHVHKNIVILNIGYDVVLQHI